MRSVRVGIAGFLHESNTFLPVPTTIGDFEAMSWTHGEAMEKRWAQAHHELGGMFAGCYEYGLSPVPLMATLAIPSGALTPQTFEAIAGQIVSAMRAALPLDGILLALHGATVAENFPDADGEISRRVRELVGPEIPVIQTLDLHANVSMQMVRNTDATVCYRTNPHLDQRERGREAAKLMARTLAGEIHPVQALASPPWIVPIDRQYTSQEPASLLYAIAARAAAQPGILSTSVAMGFYYADVAEMGISFIAVADGDRELAARTAAQMAEEAWALRQQFGCQLTPVEEAVGIAAAADQTPVALFDVGDNVGGGSPADSTVLLAELMRQGVGRSLAILYDPEAAAQCAEAGVRQSVDLLVGAKTDGKHGQPVRLTGRVRTLSDGQFTEPEVRHGGWGILDQGLTAVVETEDRTLVVLTSRRMAPMSLHQVLSLGIRPETMRAIVVKGVVAPRAAYEPVCKRIVMVDTPGVTAGNPAHFVYQHRRPMFPLEPETIYHSGEASL